MFMNEILKKVQVNIPFTMLYESYLSRFMEYGINPEIGFDAISLDRFSLSDFEGIAERISQRGLSTTLHAPFIDLSPGSPDPAVRDLTRHRFQQMLPLIPVFQPRTVVCHMGWDEKRCWYYRESWIQHSLEFWSWFAEGINKEGAVLVLENVYESNPTEFLKFFTDLKDQDVGFCLDSGHHAVFSRVSLSEWLKPLAQYIAQLHLHDNYGSRDDHLALGKGNIDFEALLRHLKDAKSHPPIITLEPHREEDLGPSLEYLENIWPW